MSEEVVHATMQSNYASSLDALEQRITGTVANSTEGPRPISIKLANRQLGDAVEPDMQTPETASSNASEQSFPDGFPYPNEGVSFSEPPSQQAVTEPQPIDYSRMQQSEGTVDMTDLMDEATLSARAEAEAKRAQLRTLSNEDLARICKPFIEGSGVARPTFISRPIMKRVYIGVYAGYREILEAEKLLGYPPKEAGFNVVVEYNLLAEVSSVIKGYLFEHDPGIGIISMYSGDYSKWPKLYPVRILDALHPSMRQVIFPQLAAQYVEWKALVTPTQAELEKYSGSIG